MFSASSSKRDPYLSPPLPVRLWREVFLAFAKMVLRMHHYMFLGLRVRGRRHLWRLRGGAITVLNHVHLLDSAVAACQPFARKTFFPTLPENLHLPLVGFLVRSLGGFPIPHDLPSTATFHRRMQALLEGRQLVHFFPEGDLSPYDPALRPFHDGAFWYAQRFGVPIVPMVLSYRPVRGVRKLLRKKPLLNLTILPPLRPEPGAPRDLEVRRLREQCFQAMADVIGPGGAGASEPQREKPRRDPRRARPPCRWRMTPESGIMRASIDRRNTG